MDVKNSVNYWHSNKIYSVNEKLVNFRTLYFWKTIPIVPCSTFQTNGPIFAQWYANNINTFKHEDLNYDTNSYYIVYIHDSLLFSP